jgi:hypothetical protein
MKNVEIKSDVNFMDWQLKRQEIKMLEIDDQPFAKGGYSSLFRIKSNLSHEFEPSVEWLLKLSYSSDPICKSGYRNIAELSTKLSQWQSARYTDNISLFIEYQALIGFPQAYFVGEYERQEVYGYIVPNLIDLGFTLFSDIEDNEDLHNAYLESSHDTFNSRLKSVYNLAKTFYLLQNEFEYSHGDIKAKSVWINLATYGVAIIDFDGGMFRSTLLERIKKMFAAQIMGEQQPWLAPEILKEVNEETGDAKLQVSWQSDYWSFACGTFHLLTGLSPFSFLKESTFQAWKHYLKSCDWPSLDFGAQYLMIQKEEAHTLNGLFSEIRSRTKLWERFKRTFNEGFKDKSVRTTYSDWLAAFSTEISDKKPVANLKVSQKVILEGGTSEISWNCGNGLIFINGKRYPAKGVLSQIIDQAPVIKVVNEFGDWPIDMDIEVVRKPIISEFQTSSILIPVGKSIEIKWQSSHVHNVSVIVDAQNFEVTGSAFECSPKSSQEIEVKFASKYGLEVLSKTFSIEVIHPVVINNYVSDKDFIAETLPVLLKWETTNADEVKITNTEKPLEKSGEITLRPKHSGEITLTARNKFFDCKKSIYVEVFPIPKIENVKLPAFPRLNIDLPDFTSNIPTLLKSIDGPKELFNQIFTENELKKDS